MLRLRDNYCGNDEGKVFYLETLLLCAAVDKFLLST